ncbi:hypothetical protein [Streptomyces sp. NPDC056544]|uniref:hypothetical protein n=1 Tax=unclassified Streptomyces TaxID=2593676 RepID=UPI003688E9D3
MGEGAGADLRATSVHKMGSGLEQSSVFHLYGYALTLAGRLRDRITRIDGLHVHGRTDFCGPGKASDLDPLQIIIDISACHVTGHRAADWLRRHHRINLYFCDHRCIRAQLTHADGDHTADSLLTALTDFAAHAPNCVPDSPCTSPDLPNSGWSRRHCLGTRSSDGLSKSSGNGPREVLPPRTADVLRYLRTGVEAGMVVPDAVDTDVTSIRVLREEG